MCKTVSKQNELDAMILDQLLKMMAILPLKLCGLLSSLYCSKTCHSKDSWEYKVSHKFLYIGKITFLLWETLLFNSIRVMFTLLKSGPEYGLTGIFDFFDDDENINADKY